jgi:hypothetical protein
MKISKYFQPGRKREMEKTIQQRASCSLLLTGYHSVDQVKKTVMVRSCSTYGGRGEVHTEF